MMLGEMIWGDDFVREMSQPHSDPEIRKTEEQANEFWRQYMMNRYGPKRFDNSRYLPAHYRSKE